MSTPRQLLRALPLALFCLLGCAANAAPHGNGAAARQTDTYAFQRVVYQNSGGYPDDKTYGQRVLRHVAAHIAATNGNVEIRVVSFAAGVKLFLTAKEDPEIARSLDDLRAKGVRFLICRNTLNGLKLQPSDLYGVTEADVVPSGVAELAKLQGMGFVYIHP